MIAALHAIIAEARQECAFPNSVEAIRKVLLTEKYRNKIAAVRGLTTYLYVKGIIETIRGFFGADPAT